MKMATIKKACDLCVSSDEVLEGYFLVSGKENTHSVRKDERGWACDCQYWSLHFTDCSHILAVRMLVGE